MEKDRGYYSLGILADQGAPWLARPQPNSGPAERPSGQPMLSGVAGACPERARRVASAHWCVVTVAKCNTWCSDFLLIDDGGVEPLAGRWSR
jgi:hypothetical protein